MSVAVNARYELEARLTEAKVGKCHVSTRFEPGVRIVRVGVCLDQFDWETRMRTIDALIEFETDHRDSFAIDFDVVPLSAVNDEHFASA